MKRAARLTSGPASPSSRRGSAHARLVTGRCRRRFFASPPVAPNSVDLHLRLLLDEPVLLTKRKTTHSRLLSLTKARQSLPADVDAAAALVHEKQLAVLDAVEWAAERWTLREGPAGDPRATHAARLVAALVYLDPRFERLDPAFVIELIDRVVDPPLALATGPRLDAKAAAALLMVEVAAFGR